jgi:hypothetical protein
MKFFLQEGAKMVEMTGGCQCGVVIRWRAVGLEVQA